MNKWTSLFAAMLALWLCPGPVAAQNGFRVDPSTGLGGGNAPATPKKQERDFFARDAERTPTEITASKETTFDEKTRKAVFLGDVTVKDSQFNLTCEKLTAHLRRGDSKSGDEAPKPAEGGGLERAIAEGGVVIVQEKVDDKGRATRYVGKAEKAEYDAASGNVTLTGWPQIQQGINTQVATERGTVMILNKVGALKTIGPSKTVISDSSEPIPARKAKEGAGAASTSAGR